jgi:hypothetical protein
LNEQRKRVELNLSEKYTINAQNTIYVNHPKKTLKGKFAESQGGLSGSSLLRSDGSPDSQTGGWTSREAAKGTPN